MRKSIGYGVYGQNPFQPDFTICKSEGGTANCPSEYVKEFSGLGQTSGSMWPMLIGGAVVLAIGVWVFISLRSFDAATAS